MAGSIGFGEIQFGQRGCGAGTDDAVATSVLGLVERVVSELEEEIDAVGGFIEGRDADGDSESVCSQLIGPIPVFLEALADFFSAHGRLQEGALGQATVFGTHAAQKSLPESG